MYTPNRVRSTLCVLWAFLHVAYASHVYTERASSAPIATVNLGYATYQGTFDPGSNTTSFQGIRYAAPPTGSLRWEAPQAPANVTGVQNATAVPNICMQSSEGTSPTNPFTAVSGLVKRADALTQSEDCLFLTVNTPGSSLSGNLPVIVWIHGGGYGVGWASAFNGSDLIASARGGVITVIIQYRLAAFGFLSGSEVQKGGVSNAGLLDQQFALQWVQKHIKSFGGDPSKVTIWGESAGAGSVLNHLIANGGETSPPLFRAGIASSTYLPSQYEFNHPINEFLYSAFVNQTSCASSADTLSCLRSAPTTALQNASFNIAANAFFGTFNWVPVVDGHFIRERPTEAFKSGKLNTKNLLTVTNTFEGLIFVNTTAAPADNNLAAYMTTLFPTLSVQSAAKGAELYNQTVGGTTFDQAVAVMGESILICPTYSMMAGVDQHGTTFKGEFAVPPGTHGSDVLYYFPSSAAAIGVPSPTFFPPSFVESFAGSFEAFAISLNPNAHPQGDLTPEWATWSLGNGKEVEMVFNQSAINPNAGAIASSATSGKVLERCAFWESVSGETNQ